MAKLHVKTGDTVVILSGKDKGQKGKVLETSPKEGKVKPRRQGQAGGIVKAEGALYACKVQAVCPKCQKATRPAHKVADGKKVRVCKHCGAEY